MTKKTSFSGSGFSREPFTEEENASHRELMREVSEAWPTIDSVDQISKASGRLARIAAVVAALGGVVAYLVKQGVFL